MEDTSNLTPEERLLYAIFGRVPESKEPSPLDAAAKKESEGKLIKNIDEILKTLPYREREIVKLRYGLDDDGKIHSLEEVGNMFKVTRERIRQIEAKAVRKLTHPIRARQLEGFLDATKQKAEDPPQS